MKASTGLRDALLDTAPLKTALTLCELRIFSGAEPADADAAETGTLLVVIDNGGTGGTFEAAAVSGAIQKLASETWSGTVGPGGTATHFRLIVKGETTLLDATVARIQGTINVAGADLNLTDTLLVLSNVQTIDSFAVALPTL